MSENKKEDIALNLGIGGDGQSKRRWYKKRRWMLVGVILISIGGWLLWPHSGAKAVKYITEAATNGDLVVKVTATGNLQPTTEVEVSSELSGIIEEVLVNDNDQVKKDQVLAKLDTSKLEDQVFKSEAALKSAQASVLSAKAAMGEAKTNLERLQEAWKLSGGKVPSKSDITSAQAAFEKAQAAEMGAEAAVSQSEAALRSDKTNLAKAEIKSPIDGIVLLRSAEPGQTVAASLQAPVLFKLAQSLTQMELQINIDEADVGQVREGQEASFTVDAYSDRVFPAKITKIRYGSETTNGVVTYQGVLEVTNDDLSLRPGMTATASIITLKREKALLIPNAALRFVPEFDDGSAKKSGSVIGALIPHPSMMRKSKVVSVVNKGSNQSVWLLKDEKLSPVEVVIKTGASDGKMTEVLSGDIKPGDRLVTESEVPEK